ncbi:MAG: 1-deoxy-D-xylulose-5-phosphate reductoisomerase [Pelagibacterales bacterium]|nr:1-deoxy-D-xylulose-5-phosphate reductoisomerase [Pelagibacterales bacterium]
MKQLISILGSTGSIGLTTLKIIEKKKNLLKVDTLVANKNYNLICKQVIKFKPINFIITDAITFLKVKKKFKKSKTKIVNNFSDLSIKKTDITISAIPGLLGLKPTLNFIKISKKILLANKESIICGWDILKKSAKKYKTIIIPIDSEHFSIQQLLKNHKTSEIKKIYITASGGPFLNLPIKKFKFIKPTDAVKHPKWKMGKKISIDSATLMNKILELAEAYKIFPYEKNKYQIVIHPQSLVHAIVVLKNGITKFLYHKPDMIIPIANAIFNSRIDISDFFKKNYQKSNKIDNLQFKKVDKTRFPMIKLIPKLNAHVSAPIIINASNEILIDLFLKNKISFSSISDYVSRVLKDKNYKKYAIYKANNLNRINTIDNWARLTVLKIVDQNK